MKKKLLAATLALCMVFGSAAALPEGVFSESASITASAVSTATSGMCGEDVYWSVENGVLTISGTGDMEDYGFFSRPFAGKGIKSVVIKSGVTSIGEFAFHECYSITSVTIPNTVTSIGEFAFYDCSSLAKVNIPKSVTNIGSNAFKHCVSLSSITFPSSIKSIGDYVFNGCKGLTKVNIPSSVTNIGINAFADCTNLKSVTIPKSVTSINAWAFWGTKWLEIQRKKNPLVVVNGILIDASATKGNVTIPSSVKSVGSGAFSGCKNLTGVTIPNSVTSIGWSAFNNCENLTKVTIPSSIKSIGDYTFENCTSLTSVTIPSSVKTIGTEAFWRCTNLKSVTIQKGVTSIGKKAFSQCGSLTKVTIPGGVTSIGDEAFSNCLNLKSVTIPGSVKSIGKSAFYRCTSLISVTMQKGVNSIGEEAFEACMELTSVTIPSSVKSIGNYAFMSCKSLPSVTIAGSDTSIGNEAFTYCTSLKSVTIQNGVTSIGDRTFDDCKSLTSVYIPDSVKSIGEQAFYNCFSLTSVTIPDSVTSIGKEAFGHYYYNDSFQFGKVYGFTINGYKGTAAQKYAKDNSFKFVEIKLPNQTRFAGANRYDTAALLSKASKTTSNTVIIADAMTFQDALIAVPLAKAYNAPLLLANPNIVTKQTEAELARLKAKKVIIVNTSNALKSGTINALKNKYSTQIIRGNNCFETSKRVAEALQAKTKKAPTDVFFTTNKAFADALSISPVAALKGAPILYVDPSKKTLDSNILAYLNKVKGSVKNVYIVGGKVAVPAAIENSIKKALPKKNVKRFDGAQRYETCVMINKYFAGLLNSKTVCVAKGLDFPDALAGGVFAANQKAPLLLADSALRDAHKSFLKAKKPNKLYIFGGTVAVPDKLAKEVAKMSV